MQIETVQYIVLNDQEISQLRKYIMSCNPATQDHALWESVRTRLLNDRKFQLSYVHTQVIPYLSYLISHYDDDLTNANQELQTAEGNNVLGDVRLQWQVIAEARQEQILRVREILSMFAGGINGTCCN